MLRLKRLKLQQGSNKDDASDTYAKRLAWQQANLDANVIQDVDRAEMALLGSYQRPQQVFADAPATSQVQLASPLTSPMTYSPTLSQYVGSTVPIQLAGLNLNKALDKGLGYIKKGVATPESLEPDTPYRNAIEKKYNDMLEDIANKASTGEITKRQAFQSAINVKDAFAKDRQMEAYTNNLGKYQKSRENSQKLYNEGKITLDAHKSLDEINKLRYASQGGVGEAPDEFGNYKGINLLDPARYVDIVKKGNEIIKDWTPDQKAWANAFATGNGYIYDEKGTRRYVTQDEVGKGVLNAFRNDPELMEFIGQQSLLKSYDEGKKQGLQGLEALQYAQQNYDKIAQNILGTSVKTFTDKGSFVQDTLDKNLKPDDWFIKQASWGREDEKERQQALLLNEQNTSMYKVGGDSPFANYNADPLKDFTTSSVPTNYGTIQTVYKIKGKEVTAEEFQKQKAIASKKKDINDPEVNTVFDNMGGNKIPDGNKMTTKQKVEWINKNWKPDVYQIAFKGDESINKQLTNDAQSNAINRKYTLPNGTKGATFGEFVKYLDENGQIPAKLDGMSKEQWVIKNIQSTGVTASNYNEKDNRPATRIQIGNVEVLQDTDNTYQSGLKGSSEMGRKFANPASKDFKTPNTFTIEGKKVQGYNDFDESGNPVQHIYNTDGKYLGTYPANEMFKLEIQGFNESRYIGLPKRGDNTKGLEKTPYKTEEER